MWWCDNKLFPQTAIRYSFIINNAPYVFVLCMDYDSHSSHRQRPERGRILRKGKSGMLCVPQWLKGFGLVSKGNPVEFVCVYVHIHMCGVWKISNFPFTLQPNSTNRKHREALKNTKILPLFSSTECSKNSPGSENILLLIQSAWLQRAAPLSQPLETSTTLTFAQILPTDTYSTWDYDDWTIFPNWYCIKRRASCHMEKDKLGL